MFVGEVGGELTLCGEVFVCVGGPCIGEACV